MSKDANLFGELRGGTFGKDLLLYGDPVFVPYNYESHPLFMSCDFSRFFEANESKEAITNDDDTPPEPQNCTCMCKKHGPVTHVYDATTKQWRPVCLKGKVRKNSSGKCSAFTKKQCEIEKERVKSNKKQKKLEDKNKHLNVSRESFVVLNPNEFGAYLQDCMGRLYAAVPRREKPDEDEEFEFFTAPASIESQMLISGIEMFQTVSRDLFDYLKNKGGVFRMAVIIFDKKQFCPQEKEACWARRKSKRAPATPYEPHYELHAHGLTNKSLSEDDPNYHEGIDVERFLVSPHLRAQFYVFFRDCLIADQTIPIHSTILLDYAEEGPYRIHVNKDGQKEIYQMYSLRNEIGEADNAIVAWSIFLQKNYHVVASVRDRDVWTVFALHAHRFKGTKKVFFRYDDKHSPDMARALKKMHESNVSVRSMTISCLLLGTDYMQKREILEGVGVKNIVNVVRYLCEVKKINALGKNAFEYMLRMIYSCQFDKKYDCTKEEPKTRTELEACARIGEKRTTALPTKETIEECREKLEWNYWYWSTLQGHVPDLDPKCFPIPRAKQKIDSKIIAFAPCEGCKFVGDRFAVPEPRMKNVRFKADVEKEKKAIEAEAAGFVTNDEIQKSSNRKRKNVDWTEFVEEYGSQEMSQETEMTSHKRHEPEKEYTSTLEEVKEEDDDNDIAAIESDNSTVPELETASKVKFMEPKKTMKLLDTFAFKPSLASPKRSILKSSPRSSTDMTTPMKNMPYANNSFNKGEFMKIPLLKLQISLVPSMPRDFVKAHPEMMFVCTNTLRGKQKSNLDKLVNAVPIPVMYDEHTFYSEAHVKDAKAAIDSAMEAILNRLLAGKYKSIKFWKSGTHIEHAAKGLDDYLQQKLNDLINIIRPSLLKKPF